ncbi:hypothetical protein BAUCODRAFT_31478 [Baudoinia panamericana UAMH 10762]|uniref:Uncharacterized protein n=1 Tax=Baudoinia panamericana (strain UAMH 10762) TaxID=717646 RepID=M2LWV8_BAUPA|nr:uncharacterized protein BAUCODRAFT_31478 [Baudoinia panamericana UAMH 10762]EMC99162.1 hypothetical protein BAUCODRAFT_31478 [Baudoinia panamericana UAMH 10762]
MAKQVAASNLSTGPDTYMYALAHVGDYFATIASDDSLRIFDASLRQLAVTQPRNAGLACLETYDNNTVLTAGRDGIVRRCDSRAKQVSQVSEPQGRSISALACREHLVAAGTESTKEGLGDVSVLLYDLRNPAVPMRNYAESHTDSITQLAFHPVHPNGLLSGSTDGLVSLFDLGMAEEEDALQQVLNPRSAVHCAGFLSPDEVYILTTDEQFSIYSLAEAAVNGDATAQAIDFGDVRSKLDCMYVIDLLKQADGQPVVAHGHNERQTLTLTQLGKPASWAFGQSLQLPGAHGGEVVRDMLLTGDRAYSCGEDGHVRVWKWT